VTHRSFSHYTHVLGCRHVITCFLNLFLVSCCRHDLFDVGGDVALYILVHFVIVYYPFEWVILCVGVLAMLRYRCLVWFSAFLFVW
jgi:hypothetical protein